MVAVVLVTVASGGSLSVRAVAPVQIAVVVPAEVNVLAAMRTDAVVRFVLHGGSEVRVEVESDDWLRVALPDGQQGWLERRYLEIFQL
jgi:SH3-like domain-containing protein